MEIYGFQKMENDFERSVKFNRVHSIHSIEEQRNKII
jgi:hypothetical protein